MQPVKKAEAARILHLSKSRISQLVKAGMPVREDGLIDVAEAREWMAANLDPMRRAGWASAKAERVPPESAAPHGQAEAGSSHAEGSRQGFIAAMVVTLDAAAFHAVEAAAEAGVNREQATTIADAVLTALRGELVDTAKQIGTTAPGFVPEVLLAAEDRGANWRAWFPWAEAFDKAGNSMMGARSKQH